MMKPTSVFSSGVWYGVFFQITLNMLFQDYLGLEGYVAWITPRWVEMSPWWGGTALVVVVCGMAGRYARCAKLEVELESEESK